MKKYFLAIFALGNSLLITAQVQVRNEPRHHNVFENEFIRILDVYLPPEDTTQYHLHNTPSVFIILANTNVSSQLMGKQPQKGANIAGDISYDGLAIPRLHRVWNEDTSWFHVMDIELTRQHPDIDIPLLRDSSLNFLFNEPLVNGYKLNANNGKSINLSSSKDGYLLVSLGEAIVYVKQNDDGQRRIMKRGHYIWIQPGKMLTISVSDRLSADFVLLQFK